MQNTAKHRKSPTLLARIFGRKTMVWFASVSVAAAGVVTPFYAASAANDLGYNSTVDYAMTFNGSSQSASTTATSVIPGASSFTVEAWFNETSGATGQRIFLGQGVAGNANARFALGLDGAANNRSFQIWMKGAQVVSLTSTISSQDAWHHVAVGFTSGTGYTVYFDGNLISTITNTETVNIAGAFWVGRNYYAAGNYFSGKIDEVKIWNTVRSASQVASDMHVYGSDNSTTFDSNLRAYYDMNEGSGSAVYNRTATSGLNLTANASPTYEDVKTTSKNSGKTVLSFPRTYLTPVGGWTVPLGATRGEVLVAGGGGGGAENVGAGGSGGGLAYSPAKPMTPLSAMSVVVGQGGKGATYYLDNASNSTSVSALRDGANGQNSSVGFATALVGTGGTGGQTYWLDNKCGGAGNNNVDSLGVVGTGGDSNLAGGTGGKGASGSGAGFNGGAGNSGWTIRSAAGETFGGGGGGGSFGSASGGTGGTGAGSGGSTSGASGSAALVNTGGGGGGGSLNCGAGGNGGSGIVIIAYAPSDDKSMFFNGTSQSASAASSTVISASGAFTVEAWVKADTDIPSNAVILSQGTGTNRFYLKRNGGNLIAYRDGGASEINCGPLATAQWTHIAVSMDGTSAYCFIDGALTKSVSNSFSTKAIAAKFYVGQYSAAPTGATEYWKGSIDQIKIWNSAITSSALIIRSMNAYADKDAAGYISGSAAAAALTQLFDFNEASASLISAAVGNESLSTVILPNLEKVVTETSFGANTAYTFTRTILTAFGGWFNPNSSYVGQALIVGGGGGGGKPGNPSYLTGGGGGAGAVYQMNNLTVPSTAIPVTVGTGGRGGQITTDQGLPGGDSSIGTLLVGGGGGGNSYQYVGARTLTPGGSGYVAGGNGGGGRQDAGTATASYNLGGLAGVAANQTYNGVSYSALTGIAGINDDPNDSGSGGLGGQSSSRVSNITGGTVTYAKKSSYRIWSDVSNLDTDKTPGSGGSPNYKYGAGTTSDVGENGAAGIVVISMGPAPVINMQSSSVTSLPANATKWNSIAPGVSLDSTAVSGVTLKTSPIRALSVADGGYVNMGSNNAANISGAITVEAWVKCNPTSYRSGANTWNIFASHWFSSATAGSGDQDWHFGIYNNKLNVYLTSTNISGNTTWNSTNCANWNQFVFTLDASGNLKLYVNGVEDGSATGVSRTPSATNVLRIGDGRSGSTTFIGDYSVFRMYNTALTASQVSANYTATNASLVPTSAITVTFNSNSGSSVTDGSTTSGGTVAEPTAPVRAGYAFAGWYTTSDLSGSAISSWPYAHGQTANFTLYAKWTANPTRTVTYALAGGTSTLPTQSAVQDGLNFNVAAAADRTGYTFAGWSDGSSTYNAADSYLVGSSNVTLTATWTANTLNVTWDSNGGSAVAGTTTVTGGTIASAPSTPTKSGYDFVGWFEQSGLTSQAGFPNYVHGKTANFTLYAKWDAKTYTITYKPGTNGTGTDIVQSFVYGNTATLRDATAPFTRAGYSISGWAASDGGAQSRALSASYSSAGDLVLYPVWSANSNTVTYDEQQGSSVSDDSFNTGSTLTLAAQPVRNGYTFNGWYDASTGGNRLGNAGATISPTATSAITVYAQWTAIDYNVTYDGNSQTGGSAPSDATVYHIGNNLVVLGNSGSLYLNGYTFAGWTTSQGSGTAYNSGETLVISGNMTLWAKWNANTYTVTYDTNGASGSPSASSRSYTSGSSAITHPTVGSMIKTGYTFGGWSETANGAALVGTYTTYTDKTLYAVWTIKSLNITYAKGAAASSTLGSFPNNTTGNYGSRFTLSSNVDALVDISGVTHEFIGWSDGTDKFSAGASYLIADADVTLTAQWARVYQVQYTLNGGTGVLTSDSECLTNAGGGVWLCSQNQVITASMAPNRTGYTFTGWKNQSGTDIASGAQFTVNSGSYLLYAQWSATNYGVTYYAAGGSTPPNSLTKNYGDIFTIGSAINRTGYTFAGWNDGTSTYGVGASYQMPAGAVGLTAQWTPNVYAISFDWNGGTGSATANANYTVGTAGLTLPGVGNHVKDGYSFVGWSETRNGTPLSGAYQATQSGTLFAIWGSGSFTVTYDANGGTASAASSSVLNGGSTILPSATRDNYVFEGWYSAQSGGSNRGMATGVFTPSSSTTLYARWTQLSLYGINPAHLTRLASVNAQSGVQASISASNAGSSVQAVIPAGTLPNGTTINVDLVGDFSRASALMSDPNNYIVSMVVSWVAPDGTVPNTNTGKAVAVTIQNSTIKAGSKIYSILGSDVTVLGTATQDGTVTVSLTSDPEIVIAATVPDAPVTVTATAGTTGSAIVNWNAPNSNGGSNITGYTVTASTGQTCTSATTSCIVSGLTSGASYTFTVRATNSVGTSVASLASSSLLVGSAPATGNPNMGAPIKGPLAIGDNNMQIIAVDKKKVATTGGSVVKLDTKNIREITHVTVDGKKAKILSTVDGQIKVEMPKNTTGEAKVVLTGPDGTVALEQVIIYEAPKPVAIVKSVAMPQGIWTIATPEMQKLKASLAKNSDAVVITCEGYQSYAYNTAFDALVAKQRAKTACAYLSTGNPGITVVTKVTRTKLIGPASRKLKVTFSAVR